MQCWGENRAGIDIRCIRVDPFSVLPTNFDSRVKISCISANAACLTSSKMNVLILFKFGLKVFFFLATALPKLFQKINELQQYLRSTENW